LQVCVVFLGFGMDLPIVFRTGLQGAGLAAATIATTFGLGWILRKRFGIDRKISTLISAGTAICGGSAIAAVGSVIGVGAGSLVYRLFCARLGGAQFCALDGRSIPGVGACGHDRSDAHALSDRRGVVGENAARGRLATVLAGRPSLALYQRRLTCGNHPSCLT